MRALIYTDLFMVTVVQTEEELQILGLVNEYSNDFLDVPEELVERYKQAEKAFTSTMDELKLIKWRR